MDVQGKWHFKEDFGYGVDEGEMTIRQEGCKISGSMVYEERIKDDQPFTVCVDIEGMCVDDQIRFKGVSYEIFGIDDNCIFNLEVRHGKILNDSLIEGTSMDSDGIEGHFIMVKK